MLDFIVKLGGSVLTNKAVQETTRPDAIKESIDILSELFKAGKKFIVLHGVGSFGHHLAHKHGINSGFLKGDKTILLVLAVIRESFMKLNRQVIEEFLVREIPAFNVSTFEDWKTSEGKVTGHSTWAVQKLLEEGFLPVLHGNWVFDDVQGSGVLSSDVIMEVLCETFKPKRVIFVTDCGCVLSHPPHHKESEPIRQLQVSDIDEHLQNIEINSVVPDASGGMRTKIDNAVSIVRKSKGSIAVFFSPLGEVMKTLCDLKDVTGDQLMTEFIFKESNLT